MHLKRLVRDILIYSFAFFSDVLYTERPRMRVLALHDTPQKNREEFKRKMQWLKEHCNVVPLDHLFYCDNLDDTRLNIAITFDDGFKEYATFAAPLLRSLSLPATFFIPSGAVGLRGDNAQKFSREDLRRSGTFAFMDETDIRALANDPLFEIGGHTMHHADLGTISTSHLEEEIAGDKRALEAIIGKPLRFFAYSFGGPTNLSAAAADTIKSAGYLAAFTIIPAFWARDRDPYFIGRDSLSVTDSDTLWMACLEGGYDAISRIKSRTHL